MIFPKLQKKARQLHVCTNFHGLFKNPQAKLGYWYDEQNLSTDAVPAACVRKNRAAVSEIDGNTVDGVLSAAAMDHLCILDRYGVLHTNGRTFKILKTTKFFTVTSAHGSALAAGQIEITNKDKLNQAIGSDWNDGDCTFTLHNSGLGDVPVADSLWRNETRDDDPNYALRQQDIPYADLGIDLHYAGDLQAGTEITFRVQSFTQGTEPLLEVAAVSGNGITTDDVEIQNPAAFSTAYGDTDQTMTLTATPYTSGGKRLWYDSKGHSHAEYYYGIWLATVPNTDATITLKYTSRKNATPRTMVPMGAHLTIWPDKKFINAVKLANLEDGEYLIENEDFGDLERIGKNPASQLTVTLCDAEGNAFSGVTVGTTAPGSGYWIDTSEDSISLKEYSQSTQTWIVISSTYLKIQCNSGGIGYKLKQGDGVTLKTEGFDFDGDKDLEFALNSAQVLTKVNDSSSISGYVIVPGIMRDDNVTLNLDGTGWIHINRTVPDMDFVVECGNRLWGCRYGDQGGEIVNELYASKLGDFKNWNVFEGLSTDSWAASRGTDGPFTGASVLDGSPLFFREGSLEKVYPSSTGAHRVQTFNLDGVEPGSENSLVVIDGRLYYKARSGICAYNGTLPRRISEVFGDEIYKNGIAGRHGAKYYVSLEKTDGSRVLAVLDTEEGDWHLEDSPWVWNTVTWHDRLYFADDGGQMWQVDGGSDQRGIRWYAETGTLAMELPEHKFISKIALRFRLELNATCRVLISYDGRDWERHGALRGSSTGSQLVNIFPRRCDHFRLRLEGTGGIWLQSVSYWIERSGS